MVFKNQSVYKDGLVTFSINLRKITSAYTEIVFPVLFRWHIWAKRVIF